MKKSTTRTDNWSKAKKTQTHCSSHRYFADRLRPLSSQKNQDGFGRTNSVLDPENFKSHILHSQLQHVRSFAKIFASHTNIWEKNTPLFYLSQLLGKRFRH